ncbi:MAG: DUF3467 domain-containing protein [Chloroflexi bacterium]|nr:DUF3467 domain-containing protein [Chloroflexota bacterium]
MSTPPRPAQLPVEIPPDLQETYSNFVLIQHAPSEFFLDFARILPNIPKARVGARVMMTPLHAKLLLRALQENIDRYEAQFGTIYIPQGDGLAKQLFGGGDPGPGSPK